MTLIIAWLNSKLAIIRWIVVGISIIASFCAGKHWEWLEWQADKSEHQAATIRTVYVNKTIRDRIAGLPAGDVNKLLLGGWSRD